ncbi:MAG: AI-2E family transporter [Bacteroidota bacterium]
MTQSEISFKQVNGFLFCGVLVCAVLYFAKAVLMPVTFAIFFAMLFTSLSNKMEKKGMPRILSTLISILILVTVISGIALLVFIQSKNIAKDFPQIEKKSEELMTKAQDYISQKLDISEAKQKEMIQKQIKSAGESFGKVLKSVVEGVFGLLMSSVLVLIFTFLFLYQREKYETFFVGLSKDKPPSETKKMLAEISKVSQNYLTGRALSIIIFTILFTVGFLIVGLKNAFLLAFIAALLTIVPYIGSIVGGLFPFVVALVTEDSFDVAIGALAVILIIQAIDNYFIEPYIIGGEVNISGFFTILILLIGGLLWNVAGMILFLPMLGVTKIVFDHVPKLRIYGYLIGDQQQGNQSDRLFAKIKKLFKK